MKIDDKEDSTSTPYRACWVSAGMSDDNKNMTGCPDGKNGCITFDNGQTVCCCDTDNCNAAMQSTTPANMMFTMVIMAVAAIALA